MRTLALPDEFQGHEDRCRHFAFAGLNGVDIVRVIDVNLARTA